MADKETKKPEQRTIVCVGLICLDIVAVCSEYPEEDTENRIVEQRWQRGGNASNTSTVLSRLGATVELVGTLADTPHKSFLLDNLESLNITTTHCPVHVDTECPSSVIIINTTTGSRTILHAHRNLPEVTAQDFAKIPLSPKHYAWVHFEGRPNVPEILEMIKLIDACSSSHVGPAKITTSVEIEQWRSEITKLFDKFDYVFVGKHYAEFRHFKTKEETATELVKLIKPGAALICAWGADGACAIRRGSDEGLVVVPAFPPEAVVDTLAAGDTFIAAVIFALAAERDLRTAVEHGCRVAGHKCGHMGGVETLQPPKLNL